MFIHLEPGIIFNLGTEPRPSNALSSFRRYFDVDLPYVYIDTTGEIATVTFVQGSNIVNKVIKFVWFISYFNFIDMT